MAHGSDSMSGPVCDEVVALRWQQKEGASNHDRSTGPHHGATRTAHGRRSQAGATDQHCFL